jgi:hypothetical protein
MAAINGDGIKGEEGLDIYTQVESEYFGSMLKKKRGKSDLCTNAELRAIFEKALFTLKVIMESLLQGRIYQQLKQQYTEDQKNDKKGENTIKLLMRCYKMYQAREEVMRILRMVDKREKQRERGVNAESFKEYLQLSSRCLQKIIHL